MRFFESPRDHPSVQDINSFLSLHNEYCDLLTSSNPHTAAVMRKQLSRTIVGGWSRDEFNQRKAQLAAKLRRVSDQHATLDTWKATMDQVDQMQREICDWAPKLASTMEYLLLMYPERPLAPEWRKRLAAAKLLSDRAYVESLSVEQLTTYHEQLAAFIADKKMHAERNRKLADEVKDAFKDL